jgi:hypothetical protein
MLNRVKSWIKINKKILFRTTLTILFVGLVVCIIWYAGIWSSRIIYPTAGFMRASLEGKWYWEYNDAEMISGDGWSVKNTQTRVLVLKTASVEETVTRDERADSFKFRIKYHPWLGSITKYYVAGGKSTIIVERNSSGRTVLNTFEGYYSKLPNLP